MQKLLDGVEANTDGDGVEMRGSTQTIVAWSTDFGGGTVTLETSPDNGTTWIGLTISGSPAAFTANAVRLIDRLGQGLQIRATLTGATGPDPVFVSIY